MSLYIRFHGSSEESKRDRLKVGIFGHFGGGNFGNESTLQAMLYHVRRLIPNADVTCICSVAETVAADYNIATVPISGVVVRPWTIRNPLAKLARKLTIGIVSELYRWYMGLMMLRGWDVLIVPGTGLLTDAYSLSGWGPYSVFKWSVIAKMCRCKLFFVSVGVGPLHSVAGRLLTKSALSLADFRSYREESSLRYLQAIGFQSDADPVYPDLAFSLPLTLLAQINRSRDRRPTVGLGLMEYAGMRSGGLTSEHYAAYMETLVVFAKWLLSRGYNVRLLFGDLMDIPVIQEFKSLLRVRHVILEERVIAEPITSAKDLFVQLAATDFVVGTRFHNVLLALLVNKPSIAISFHHKCSSLMSQMGLSEYCQDIKYLKSDMLIEQFCQLEKNASSLRCMIREKVIDCGKALEEQYQLMFKKHLRPYEH
jgi:polysaccharide pyruvyl transferase WcaK-like protein